MNQIIYPLGGGVLIAIASTVLLGGLGRVLGVSGILGSFLQGDQKENLWRVFWLMGLFSGGFLMKVMYPEFFNYEFNVSPLKLIVAGLLVGFGTRLGSGCTSGHGVCGLSRFSKRSFISVMIFMSVGILTVFLMSRV